ncbi:hypothetical protein LU631_24525 [Erwinia tracheiphila]|uniref:BadF/BadG/BcrA/BcrD ATPase family protein n=1 Tax=Erwinia tracheiphila TaxID=65700 RepID=UPI00033CCF20|nr:BadF/BadG/BcrA/BcrD ATPase family protein [Erwinia tracheiphila]EOS92983.1 N-acetylglucosamine kinase [Erwinia tracheiphila PSU-1]UIA87775.1 hypothetical protein LU631_24525 [Erwinia tracheiphila]UIA96140.1 hypothetical protein LU633_22965 [Erwinia tracheiphila]
MQAEFLPGIDGGGTHCRARPTSTGGSVLTECTQGPANVFSDFHTALLTLRSLFEQTVNVAGLTPAIWRKTSAVLGLAGANVLSVSARLHYVSFPFSQVTLLSDVEIACIGAHGGEPGAVLIVGTGSQGVIWSGECFRHDWRLGHGAL